MLQEMSQPPNLHFSGITPRPHDWDAIEALMCALGRKEVLQRWWECGPHSSIPCLQRALRSFHGIALVVGSGPDIDLFHRLLLRRFQRLREGQEEKSWVNSSSMAEVMVVYPELEQRKNP